MICSNCGAELAARDAATYGGRCEECWVGTQPSGTWWDGTLSSVGKYQKNSKGGRNVIEYPYTVDRINTDPRVG